MLAARRMPALPCMRSARCVQRSRLQRDRSRGRADMKRRESGKSARHARRDGWRAPLLTMLKYCRHNTRPKDRHREYEITKTQDCARTERSTTIRLPPKRSNREYCTIFLMTHGRDVLMRPRPMATRCHGEASGRSQKTLLARSNQPFSSAVNGLTAWLVVASGRAKAAGGGA